MTDSGPEPSAGPHGPGVTCADAEAQLAAMHARLEEAELQAATQCFNIQRYMPAKFKPRDVASKLGYLVEECGEVLAAAGKCQRWGLESYNPDVPEVDREPNREWLIRELQDLKRALYFIETDERFRASPDPSAPEPFPDLPAHMKQAPEGWVRMLAREEIAKAAASPEGAFFPDDRERLALRVTRTALEWNLRDARGLQSIVEKCREHIRAFRRVKELGPEHGIDAVETCERIAEALRG